MLVSATPDGAPGDGDSGEPSISADGTLVAFSSEATDLVPSDRNGPADVFVRDLRAGETALVSTRAGGLPGNGASGAPALSGDGGAVAFESEATDLVDGTPPRDRPRTEIFHRDLARGTTTWVSAAHGGGVPDGRSAAPSINADGSVVAFESDAENLTAGGNADDGDDIFLRDLDAGRTTSATDGLLGSSTGESDVDGDGDTVAFVTEGALDPDDGNGRADVYVIDLPDGRAERVSVDTVGGSANDASGEPSVSDDGRRVVFTSGATDLVNSDGGRGDGDPPGDDVFVRDRDRARTEQVNVTAQGGIPGAAAPRPSSPPTGGSSALTPVPTTWSSATPTRAAMSSSGTWRPT